jgi:hypothetical protein|nr:MAG TPA: hypothetical protein [Caudoviricetes sp.]
MSFPDYSGNGGGERFIGTVESAIKQKAGTGAPLTSQNLQDIGRTIDDEIAKVAPPAPSYRKPIDTVDVKSGSIGQCLKLGAGNFMSSWPSQVIPSDLLSAYRGDSWYHIDVPVLLAKSTDGTTEIIQISSGDTYAKTTGVDRDSWSGAPHGDNFIKYLSGVTATQLTIQKAQFVGDGKILAVTSYAVDMFSDSYYGAQNGLYQIYFRGDFYGNPQYDGPSKCWTGRLFNINSALIVYTDPSTGKQYVTQIKN